MSWSESWVEIASVLCIPRDSDRMGSPYCYKDSDAGSVLILPVAFKYV